MHGATGPTTLPLLCVPSRTSWESRQEQSKYLWHFVTRLDYSCSCFDVLSRSYEDSSEEQNTCVDLSTNQHTSLDNDLGVQAPTGFWDPAGFTADGSVEDFKRRRQTELKHGRISMLATMGYITPEQLGKTIEKVYMLLCQTWVTSQLRRLQSTNAKVQHDVCCILPNAHGCDEVVFWCIICINFFTSMTYNSYMMEWCCLID